MLYGEESCRFILEVHHTHGLALPGIVDRVGPAFKPVPHAIIKRVAISAAPAYGYAVQLLRLRDHPGLPDFLDLVTGMEIYTCLELLVEDGGTPVRLPSDRSWRALWQVFSDRDHRRSLRAPKVVQAAVDCIAGDPYPHIESVADMVLSTRIALGQISANKEERAEFKYNTRLRMLNAFLLHAGCRVPEAHETD